MKVLIFVFVAIIFIYCGYSKSDKVKKEVWTVYTVKDGVISKWHGLSTNRKVIKYNRKNQIVNETILKDTFGTISSTSIFEYKDDLLRLTKFYSSINGLADSTSYYYNSDKNLVLKKRYNLSDNWNVFVYKYTYSNNLLISELEFYGDTLNQKTIYKYDSNNQLISKSFYKKSGELDWICNIKTDENGNIIKTDQEYNTFKYVYNREKEWIKKESYNSNGQLVSFIQKEIIK